MRCSSRWPGGSGGHGRCCATCGRPSNKSHPSDSERQFPTCLIPRSRSMAERCFMLLPMRGGEGLQSRSKASRKRITAGRRAARGRGVIPNALRGRFLHYGSPSGSCRSRSPAPAILPTGVRTARLEHGRRPRVTETATASTGQRPLLGTSTLARAGRRMAATRCYNSEGSNHD